jgi:predicted RNase H-like HicB family nuclease
MPGSLANQLAAVRSKVLLEVSSPGHRQHLFRYPTTQALYCVHMTGRLSFTAVYEQVEDGWTQARIEQLPAVVTAAPTVAEAKELLVDALSEYLLSLGALDQPSPPAGTAERLPFEIVINAA